ncbi:MAG: family 20 glycosylhydrolase [Clostridium sp.]|nr:family 20 glycosylhydrolase [Bacteroides sp.]MCM1197361.1 family 20 glycosylhydrolase [Clostridium sp.]
MKHNLIIMLSLAVALCSCGTADREVPCAVIPMPASIHPGHGIFVPDTLMPLDSQVKYVLDSSVPSEGYRLSVTSRRIMLSSSTDAGRFYGMQTLHQMAAGGAIPAVEIEDAPRFAYRGLHLDVARHFFPKEEIKKVMDAMAMYKFNFLHFHITDNGGWRIQLDSFPELTRCGAFRTQGGWIEWWDKNDRRYLPEGTPGAYGGYFTKDDIRELIGYASERHIEIIPEIEFPAHSDEVFAAYPGLCCAGRTYGGGEFCIGNPDTFVFMEKVLDEIIGIFPCRYIHIGGDEARKAEWRTCPRCQALMEAEGYNDLEDLQRYAISRIEEYVEAHGRTAIGWDEIASGDISENTVAISYRGQWTASATANSGHKVIFSPGAAWYMDWYQADPETQERAMTGYAPVHKVYMIDPAPMDSLSAQRNEEMIMGGPLEKPVDWLRSQVAASNIIGVQGCLWSEFINDSAHLEYMMLPRALAIAEAAWTPQESRSWEGFRERMNVHIHYLQSLGYNCFTLSDGLEICSEVEDGTAHVTVHPEKWPVEIRYTVDGTDPDASSPLYVEPVTVRDSVIFKAAIFHDGEAGPVCTANVGTSVPLRPYYEYVEPEHWKNL